MNRTGLAIALAIGAIVGLVFGAYPQLDLRLSEPFFNPDHLGFWTRVDPTWLRARTYAVWITTAVAVPAFAALAGKLLLPRRRMLLPARAVLLMIATLALAPGLVANVVLKDNWARPRPIDVTEFKGEEHFRPWWDPRGDCPKNCSFIAGEPAGAFWTMSAAAVAPPAVRPLAYGLALAFGAASGFVRLAAGGHFVSDIVFSGVFTFLIIWLVHGLLYRWRATRISDEQVERAIERVVLPIHEPVQRLFKRRDAGEPR
jgi:lipid A 4'-phosphatase